MPDLAAYLEAMGVAALVSTLWVLAMSAAPRPFRKMRPSSICVGAICGGLAVGYWMLSLRLDWPPRNGLDRLLTLVLPAALVIELLAGSPRVPNVVAWLLRLSLSAAMLRILLHGSVYLSRRDNGWGVWEAAGVLAASGVLVAVVWGSLWSLSQRSPGISTSLAVQMSILCSGLSVMLAGYIKGGAAALPMASALVATSVATWVVTRSQSTPQDRGWSPVIGVGVVGLFGLTFIGVFFGEVSVGRACVIVLAPLLCWTTECRWLRHRKPWRVESFRLVLVAIPLVVVLILAKRDFDRELAPLLVDRQDARIHPHRGDESASWARYTGNPGRAMNWHSRKDL